MKAGKRVPQRFQSTDAQTQQQYFDETVVIIIIIITSFYIKNSAKTMLIFYC